MSVAINWTFVREDNSGQLQSLNSFSDGLTPPPTLTSPTSPTPLPHPPTNPPDVPRQLVAPCKLLRTTAPGAGEGTLACQKR